MSQIVSETESPWATMKTRREVADVLGVSLSTVQRLIRKGEIEYLRVGGQIRIDPQAMTKFRDEHLMRYV